MAGHPSGDERKDAVQVETVRALQQVFRQGKVQDEQVPSGAQHASHFLQGVRIAGHVAQPEGYGDGIVGSGGEGKVHGIRTNQIRQSPFSGYIQHGLAEVGPRQAYFRHGAQDGQGQVARASGQIQQAFRLPFRDQLNDTLPPQQVHPHAQDMVGGYITRCNGGEGGFDEFGVAHANGEGVK